VSSLENRIKSWFQKKAALHHLYVPCILFAYPGASFVIGPISFSYIDDFVIRERSTAGQWFDIYFEHLFTSMSVDGARWMATVGISGCLTKRAWELGDLACDIALAGLQLVIPLHYSARMARMTARKLPRTREKVCLVNGCLTGGGVNQEPALGMGEGCIEYFVNHGEAILQSVGHRVSGYLSSDKLFPKLEQSWCDAAYWFHEGLSEPIDAIAVAKLETAIEVLMRAENTKGSGNRLRQAIKAFYGLDSGQCVNENSHVTVDELVKGIVTDRSRILHGTWSTLKTNLRDSRPTLTYLVRDLLTNYTVELDAFVSEPSATDDIEQLLSWVQSRRQNSS